jgi:hypothetical protein
VYFCLVCNVEFEKKQRYHDVGFQGKSRYPDYTYYDIFHKKVAEIENSRFFVKIDFLPVLGIFGTEKNIYNRKKTFFLNQELKLYPITYKRIRKTFTSISCCEYLYEIKQTFTCNDS